jgi:hypothetical protein
LPKILHIIKLEMIAAVATPKRMKSVTVMSQWTKTAPRLRTMTKRRKMRKREMTKGTTGFMRH